MTRKVLIGMVIVLMGGVLFPSFFSGLAFGANAQCRLLTGANFGNVVPIEVNPAPAANAACQVGNDRGYVSRTSSGVGVNSNSVCTISASGHRLDVPYERHPAPALNSRCTV